LSIRLYHCVANSGANTPKQTRPDETTPAPTQTEAAVNVSQHDPTQAAEVASPVSDICQHVGVFYCTNFSYHMVMAGVRKK
jgi:mannose/fructose/N-acetylgalactosamine-specific phosphotransferase system component IIC